MGNTKNKLKFILWFILCLTLLTGCGSSQLSDDFNEEKVETAVKEVISIVNNKDTEALKELCNTQMKEDFSEEIIGNIYEGIDNAGEFEEIQNIAIKGQKDKETEEDYAVAVVKTKYEMAKPFYTLTFNKDMKLAGFYYK